MTPEMLIADGTADKWLVDPPREGAFAPAKARQTSNRPALALRALARCPQGPKAGRRQSALCT